MRNRHSFSLVLLAALIPLAGGVVAQPSTANIDRIFAEFDGTHLPGCAVAVSEHGHEVFSRAYGMADLEHNVPNTPETIFEPGSVAKQFTAAATILLALDGKLSLDDDVRKYIPEMPDYGDVVTIRHLLNHTSGLRDWGSVAGVEGWPRTTRVHTHDHVVDIVSRQKSLNYEPGEYYSYTNTGYNLQAVIVERVSGKSFAQFSRERIFEPLGMTHTQWRDDYRRIVKNRAIAYSPTANGGYRQNMPFENVHGNGGLLTTVGDLLRFTQNLETGELGGPEFLREMHTQGVLNSGREIAYASGLVIGRYKGVREVQHSGATAGYRGFLTRFPDQGVAVAVMCNAANANPGRFAHAAADLYLGDVLVEEDWTAPDAVDVPAERLEALTGGYVRLRDKRRVDISLEDGALQLLGRALIPTSATRFVREGNLTIDFQQAPENGRAGFTVTQSDGDVFRLEPVDDFDPTPAELADYAGEFHSEEARVTYRFEVSNGRLERVDRYGQRAALRPSYPDTFVGPGGLYLFRRTGSRVTSLSFSASRVWDLRFEKAQNQ